MCKCRMCACHVTHRLEERTPEQDLIQAVKEWHSVHNMPLTMQLSSLRNLDDAYDRYVGRA